MFPKNVFTAGPSFTDWTKSTNTATYYTFIQPQMFVFTGISLTATLLLLSSQAKKSSGSSFLRKHLLGWLCCPLLALTEEGVEKHQQDMSTEWELEASYVFCVCETDSPVFKEPHCQQVDIKPTLQLLYINSSQSQHKSWHLQLWLDIKGDRNIWLGIQSFHCDTKVIFRLSRTYKASSIRTAIDLYNIKFM